MPVGLAAGLDPSGPGSCAVQLQFFAGWCADRHVDVHERRVEPKPIAEQGKGSATSQEGG